MQQDIALAKAEHSCAIHQLISNRSIPVNARDDAAAGPAAWPVLPPSGLLAVLTMPEQLGWNLPASDLLLSGSSVFCSCSPTTARRCSASGQGHISATGSRFSILGLSGGWLT